MNVVGLILGGGAGTRLQPLTQERAKPAVPIAGKYRLVDIPISNCINSGIRKIFLLTQYNSVSLHQHIGTTFRFDQFSGGFEFQFRQVHRWPLLRIAIEWFELASRPGGSFRVIWNSCSEELQLKAGNAAWNIRC